MQQSSGQFSQGCVWQGCERRRRKEESWLSETCYWLTKSQKEKIKGTHLIAREKLNHRVSMEWRYNVEKKDARPGNDLRVTKLSLWQKGLNQAHRPGHTPAMSAGSQRCVEQNCSNTFSEEQREIKTLCACSNTSTVPISLSAGRWL